MSVFESSWSLVLLFSVATFLAVLARRVLLIFAPSLWRTVPRLLRKHDCTLLLITASGAMSAAGNLWQAPPRAMQSLSLLSVLLCVAALAFLYRESRS